ncbi:MAG: SIS domain-containing protein [Chloroflexi bacterium]|nr:SIS domain-containing protein [Chloroflexota bacterium]
MKELRPNSHSESDAAELIKRARQVVLREAEAVAKLADRFGDALPRIIRLLLECSGHVLVTGAGTSRAVAERFAHLLSCCGTPALPINASDALHGGSGAVTSQDVLYVISKGGQSLEINRFVEIARQRGARIIAQTEAPESPLGRLADEVLWVQAEEDVDPFGMVATGSSLVNAAACDALCVLLLELRGYTRESFAQTHPGGAVGQKLGHNSACPVESGPPSEED